MEAIHRTIAGYIDECESAKHDGTYYQCNQLSGTYKRTFKKVKFRKTIRNEKQIAS